MSVDPYAMCPCGNGKKIKFCKCKESVGQMDQILKMIEGGQVVPALDRLRTVLDEHPDAAWALAIRGRLLLDLQEHASLKENAERFIRLQPSNPLALTQRAAARVFEQDMQGATDSLLEALNESGQEVDAFLIDVALIVAMGLLQTGAVLSARMYGLLAINSDGYEGQQANSFMQQLDSSPSVNHLLKSTPELIERPENADWGERYDEAVRLLHSNKVLLAQDKFESLRRTAPGQPAVLSGILQCAMWRGDIDRQSEAARLLADAEDLPPVSRQRYRAISELVKPGGLTINAHSIEIQFDDVEQAEMGLIASDRTEQLPPAQLDRMQLPEEEVRPRSAFFISDRELGDSSDSAEGGPALSLGMAMVYGRQTDREAHAIAYGISEDRVDQVRDVLAAAIPGGKIEVQEGEPMPFRMAISERPIRQTQPTSVSEFMRENREFNLSHLAKRACEVPIAMLGGKSLAETADDQSLALERAAIVRILEGMEQISESDEVLKQIYEIAKVEPLPPLQPTDEELSNLTVADLFRIDPSKLSNESLFVLASMSRSSGAMTCCRQFAKRLVEQISAAADADADNNVRMKVNGYLMLMGSQIDPTEAVRIANEAIAFTKSKGISHASFLLARLELHLSMSDPEGFRDTMMALERDFGSDPAVMARVQQLLMQLGLVNPDGSPRVGPGGGAPAAAGAAPTEFTPAPAPAESGGGLWTPDQPSTPKPSEGSGGGKLWVPGMD